MSEKDFKQALNEEQEEKRWRWLPGARAGQTDQANLGCSKSPGAFDAVAARMRLISCCHNKCCQSNDHICDHHEKCEILSDEDGAPRLPE